MDQKELSVLPLAAGRVGQLLFAALALGHLAGLPTLPCQELC